MCATIQGANLARPLHMPPPPPPSPPPLTRTFVCLASYPCLPMFLVLYIPFTYILCTCVYSPNQFPPLRTDYLHNLPTLEISNQISKLNTKIEHKEHLYCVLICVPDSLNFDGNNISVFLPHARTYCTDSISTSEVRLLLGCY